jgi:hypothetical protein
MNNNCFENEEKKCLIEDILTLLGAGVIDIQLTPEMMCTILKLSIEEMVAHLQRFLITERWGNLLNKNVSKNDICLALTTRTLDYEKDFSNAYSKQVGLQASGNYELKKDYVDVIEGQQSYEIPAGRLINRVLWHTPSDIDQAVLMAMSHQNQMGYSANAGGFALGYGAGNWFANNGYYVAPAFDIFLRAADINLKHRIRQSDLTYSITAGENGKKILHLYSVPNSGSTVGIRKGQFICKVWYFYYDTIDMNAEEKNKCMSACDDIIKYPAEIPLNKIDFCDMNDTSKIWIRKYATAMAKETLGRVRSRFGNTLKIPNAEISMDGDTLLAESKEEKGALITELTEWLNILQSDKVLERKANEATNLNTILKHSPLGIFVI